MSSQQISEGGTSSFDSLGSELPEGFKLIDGRKYNKTTKYFLPMDEEEANRLDMQHICLRQVLHSNFSAPVEEDLQRGIKVLDAGCGSGAWIIEMAEDYPNSTFIGTDASDVISESVSLPPNCTFLKANTLEGLPFKDATFDYVFQRFLFAAFTPEDWSFAIKELVRVLKPEGWIESFECDIRLERPNSDLRLQNSLISLIKSRAVDMLWVFKVPSLLAANGITDIESDYAGLPIGWGGRLGELYGRNVYLTWTAPAAVLESILNMTRDEFMEMAKNTFAEMKATKSWNKVMYVFGKKPAAV